MNKGIQTDKNDPWIASESHVPLFCLFLHFDFPEEQLSWDMHTAVITHGTNSRITEKCEVMSLPGSSCDPQSQFYN